MEKGRGCAMVFRVRGMRLIRLALATSNQGQVCFTVDMAPAFDQPVAADGGFVAGGVLMAEKAGACIAAAEVKVKARADWLPRADAEMKEGGVEGVEFAVCVDTEGGRRRA